MFFTLKGLHKFCLSHDCPANPKTDTVLSRPADTRLPDEPVKVGAKFSADLIFFPYSLFVAAVVRSKQFHHILAAPILRTVQRRHAVAVLGINLGLVGQQ